MLKSKKASAEIVAFLLVLPLLLMPFFNSLQNFIALSKHDTLKQFTREMLLEAETEGGLTPAEVQTYAGRLAQLMGTDVSKVHIYYSPAPVQYGDEVYVKASYNTKLVHFTFGLGGFKRVEEPVTMSYGPIYSISKHYTR